MSTQPEEELIEVEEENTAPPSKKPKVSSSDAFTDEESEMLVGYYIPSREKFHAKFATASKNGLSLQDHLCSEWALSLTQLGIAERTGVRVKQRLADMRKRAMKYLAKEKTEISKTGGGRSSVKAPPNWVILLADAIREDPAIAGIKGGAESGKKPEPVENERPSSAPAMTMDSLKPLPTCVENSVVDLRDTETPEDYAEPFQKEQCTPSLKVKVRTAKSVLRSSRPSTPMETARDRAAELIEKEHEVAEMKLEIGRKKLQLLDIELATAYRRKQLADVEYDVFLHNNNIVETFEDKKE